MAKRAGIRKEGHDRMSQHATFDHILTSLHDAMLDDAHWPATSALIDEAVGTKGNALLAGEASQDGIRVVFAAYYWRGERRQDLEREYLETYHPRDERVPRVRRLPDSKLVRVADLYSAQEMKTSPTFNEFLPHSVGWDGLNVHLDLSRGSHITLAFCEPTQRGGWGSAQVELIERLLPHIRQFMQVRGVVAGAEALGASLTDLLDNTRIGVIHLDRRGRVVEANDRAREILRRGDGLFDEGGFLHARLPSDNIRLQKLLQGVLPTVGGPGVSGSMAIGRLPESIVHLSPVSVRQTAFGLGSVAALALVVDAASRPRVDPGLVAAVLGLTPAQSQVAALLAEGLSVNEVAAATHRQANAVYWHLKQIYKKLRVSRQADLVRLVLSAAELPGSGR